MLVKITNKSKPGYWYNADEVHNVLPRSFKERMHDGLTRRSYIVKQPVYGRTIGCRYIDVNDCIKLKEPTT